MTWYFLVFVIVGYIICGYLTGIIFYCREAIKCNGVNLLACNEKEVMTDRGLLNVESTKNSLFAISVVVGTFFPITILLFILQRIIDAFAWLLKPVTNLIMKHYKK